MKKYLYILVRVFAPLINLTVWVINLFIKRNKRIVLFGAWMGDKCADNSRFLFQYLTEHQKEYEVDKLVWVSRDTSTLRQLREYGYEAYEMHSPQSYYYHLKAGVHVVCNTSFPVKGYAGDLMGQLSSRAVKINTWHGIPIKAGKSTGENAKKQGLSGMIRYFLRRNALFLYLFTPGHWDKAYYLSTGRECTQRSSVFCGVNQRLFIEAGYPRDCISTRLFPSEEAVIQRFAEYEKVILYVPTFRENSHVPHPLSENVLQDYLMKNRILWVEKPHSATKDAIEPENAGDCVLYLGKEFDINVILSHVDLVITDYSSVTYDAAAYRCPVLYYAPDLDNYMNNERGFLCDYRSLVSEVMFADAAELVTGLGHFLRDEAFREKLMNKADEERNRVLEMQSETCGGILAGIARTTGVLKPRLEG